MNNRNSRDFFRLVYETRAVLFLETGPQTNEYRQIVLTYPQYCHMMNLIDSFGLADPVLIKNMLSESTVKLPSEIQSNYNKIQKSV